MPWRERALSAPTTPGAAAPVSAVNRGQVQRQCDTCEDEEKKREDEFPEGEIQRRGEGAPESTRGATAAVHGLGAGQPLAAGERRFFEDRFGYEFSRVRVHADGKAAEAAHALKAEAFTLKSDIAFAEGRYQTGSEAGQRLLAHELAHVIQQGQAAPLSDASAPPVQPAEARVARQADETAAPEAEPAAPEAGRAGSANSEASYGNARSESWWWLHRG